MNYLFTAMAVLIFIGLTTAFVTLKTTQIDSAVNTIETSRFLSNVENSINKLDNSQKGSEETFTFSTPKGLNQVCFIDWDNYDELSNPKLSSIAQKDKTIFFSPYSEPGDIEFSLYESPLCIKTNNKLTIKIKKESELFITSPDYSSPSCSILDLKNNGINFAFIGSGYDDEVELKKDAEKYIKTFKTTNPYNKINFNFYLVNENFENCKASTTITCDMSDLNKAVSVCPHDYYAVLINKNKMIDFIENTRSSAAGNYMKINTNDDPLVIVHEFSHIYANLFDEYTDKHYLKFNLKEENMPNCAAQFCNKWDSLENTECKKGCSTNLFYRATDNSIMNNYRRSSGKTFGIVNEKIIKEVANE